ncbi:MAG TPA: zf-HC2 domain-containing protein [Gemmataceae bacterium]|nr:zf-HC2 domain-containing protein [Gemmataceae bacterium]
MTCDELHPLLPLAIYGDLTGPEADTAAAHLRDCPACRAEAEALRRTRAALDAVPAPEVAIPATAVIRAEAARQVRALRRWKRAAVAAAALAAGLLVAVLVRPEIRVDDGALVVRWKDSPSNPPPAVVYVPQPVRDTDQAERLELLTKLVRALAEQAEGRDTDRRADIAALRTRFNVLAAQGEARWQEVQRDMGVLYRTQFARKDGAE